ncbi:MAG: RecX family transcriptional regulator [Lachnospiraceae bacterium]|nr:RecX family transcriptional regulator [Lachnospiraceae bacterium]
MIVTKIEIQKKNKNRASIYIDDEFAFGIHVNVVYDLGLRSGMEIDEDLRRRIISEEERKNARGYALKLIGYRSRCEAEVRRKMREKCYSEEITEDTISYLTDNGFLNDEEFVRLYIESKLDINKYGLNRIEYNLKGMGISRDVIRKCLAEYSEDVDEYALALPLAKKKLASLEKDDRETKYRKLSGFLGRKGYSYDVISRILRELLS